MIFESPWHRHCPASTESDSVSTKSRRPLSRLIHATSRAGEVAIPARYIYFFKVAAVPRRISTLNCVDGPRRSVIVMGEPNSPRIKRVAASVDETFCPSTFTRASPTCRGAPRVQLSQRLQIVTFPAGWKRWQQNAAQSIETQSRNGSVEVVTPWQRWSTVWSRPRLCTVWSRSTVWRLCRCRNAAGG